MSKASQEQLEALHGALADKLTEAIGDLQSDSKGLAAILNVARQLLKDNNIEATAAPGSPMGKLAGKVAQFPFNPDADGMSVN